MNKIKKISLKKEDSDIFHTLIEIFLAKWQWTKNNPRGNYLVLKVLWVTFVPVILCFLVFLFLWIIECKIRNLSYSNFGCLNLKNGFFTFSNFKLYFLPLLGVSIVVYWNMWKDYHSKWMYCCDLFNKVISYNDKDSRKRSFRIALAIDLLVTDLWAHRSFSDHFYTICEEAINSLKDKSYAQTLLTRLRTGDLTENKIFHLLNDYL